MLRDGKCSVLHGMHGQPKEGVTKPEANIFQAGRTMGATPQGAAAEGRADLEETFAGILRTSGGGPPSLPKKEQADPLNIRVFNWFTKHRGQKLTRPRRGDLESDLGTWSLS